MSDPNNKQENQVQKRNPEEDVIWLFLEASLNLGIVKKIIAENPSGKGKVLEGGRNRVFLIRSNPDYKYYLGNFDIDKLENCKVMNKQDMLVQGAGADAKYAKKNLFHTKIEYSIHTGFVNFNHNWDSPADMKDMLAEINPTKNKQNSFRYIINQENNVNKIGSLRDV